MQNYSLTQLKSEFIRLNYHWLDFHLIGIRSKANIKNKFDDLMILVNKDKLSYYQCTTNPGTKYLVQLLNPKGTAVLKPDQYIDSWKIGLHKGYEAFVQSKPVNVYRDADKDDIAEEQGKIDFGMFGINIHRANPKWKSILIDGWSAGCTTFCSPDEFKNFLTTCKLSGKKEFTYTLLKEF